MNLLTQLRSLFEPALNAIAPDKSKVPDYLAAIKPSTFVPEKPKGKDSATTNKPEELTADYQANCAMALGKALGQKPQDVAKSIIAALPPNDMIEEPTVAGPGFINLRLKPAFLATAVQS